MPPPNVLTKSNSSFKITEQQCTERERVYTVYLEYSLYRAEASVQTPYDTTPYALPTIPNPSIILTPSAGTTVNSTISAIGILEGKGAISDTMVVISYMLPL
jgi:hypothetical protein